MTLRVSHFYIYIKLEFDMAVYILIGSTNQECSYCIVATSKCIDLLHLSGDQDTLVTSFLVAIVLINVHCYFYLQLYLFN